MLTTNKFSHGFVALLVAGPLILHSASFPDSAVPLPPGWTGPVFHLSQNYPGQVPGDTYPWLQFDPVANPAAYMNAVLQYCLQGNVDVDWNLAQNTVRPWLHAPWMHWGNHGREPIHGMTYERVSQPGELASTQTSQFQNWAVGMYNAPGGYSIGQVWTNPTSPDATKSQFPANTVSIKLLFTQATVDQVPALQGAKEWQAYIYADLKHVNLGDPRVVVTLHLLQVDIAVRDPRVNSTTGWVFGTFISDGREPGTDPYARLKPVGLMWGNDPTLTPTLYNQGQRAKDTWLNPDVAPIIQHYGWLNRLDGPVDNSKSSCLSCHSVAQWPAAAGITPPAGTKEGSPVWMQWFRNIAAATPFTTGSTSLDYSLQLASGIQNQAAWLNACAANPGAKVVPPCSSAVSALTTKRRKPIPLGHPITR
jgi:hypothetical protein